MGIVNYRLDYKQFVLRYPSVPFLGMLCFNICDKIHEFEFVA
jgi:hypothetical protein